MKAGTWLVVYIAHNQHAAQSAERVLTEEGFLVRCKSLNRAVSGSGTFELCVLESEAQEARKLLIEKGF